MPVLPIPTPTGVVWTPDGRVGYEQELSHSEPVFDGDPTPVVAARLKRVVAEWKAGKAKADERGKAWADLACAWKPGVNVNVEQIAAMLSLASATSDDNVWAPFAALVVRDYGLPTTMKVMIACWSHDVHWDKNKAWLTYRPDDHQHIHDATYRAPKSALARYLQRLHREGTAADRVAIERAVDAVWETAPRHAKTALALATNDAKRAAEIARVLLADDQPHAFFAWHELPHLLADAELVEQTLAKRDESLSYRIVANLGLDALPLFEAAVSARIDKWSRTRVLQQLANLVSPRAARILAEYAEQKPYAEIVRTYFALHSELLDAMLADQELRYYHDDLVKVKQLSAP
jgi:hypothetical protein